MKNREAKRKWPIRQRMFIQLLTLMLVVFTSIFLSFNLFFENYIRSSVYLQLETGAESVNNLDFSKDTQKIELDQTDSGNYATYEEMLTAYKDDIKSIEAGDEYGNNIVSLYNPLNYIGTEDTQNPTWTKIVMDATEGDMSMFNSLNLQIAWLNAGVDSVIEWQWDGGHVPSEVLGNSLSLYVDEMYGKYVDGAVAVTKSAAMPDKENGTATEATGTNISSWVNAQDLTNVSFSLADAAVYRTDGASKAIPGFDVIDYGQEDYVFGNSETDARHWDQFVLDALKKYAVQLEPLFNAK